jgi:ribonuclease P protein component
MVFSSGCQPSKEDGLSTGEEQRAELDWQDSRPPSVSAKMGSPAGGYFPGNGENYLEIKISDYQREAGLLHFFFKKTDRILKRREFAELSKTGRRIQNEYFIAYFSPGRYNRSRLGVTVTKKVGPAVKRNRIKRLVREFFRLNRHELSGKWDINIIAKVGAEGLSWGQSHELLQNIFDRMLTDDDHR